MPCAEMILEKMKRLSPEDRAQMIKYMEDLLNYQRENGSVREEAQPARDAARAG